MASSTVETPSEAEQTADLSDQQHSCPPYLPIGRALLRFGHLLVHVEYPGNIQLDAIQVTADDSPQPEQASLAGLADLKGNIGRTTVRVSPCHRRHSMPVDRPSPRWPPAPGPITEAQR